MLLEEGWSCFLFPTADWPRRARTSLAVASSAPPSSPPPSLGPPRFRRQNSACNGQGFRQKMFVCHRPIVRPGAWGPVRPLNAESAGIRTELPRAGSLSAPQQSEQEAGVWCARGFPTICLQLP